MLYALYIVFNIVLADPILMNLIKIFTLLSFGLSAEANLVFFAKSGSFQLNFLHLSKNSGENSQPGKDASTDIISKLKRAGFSTDQSTMILQELKLHRLPTIFEVDTRLGHIEFLVRKGIFRKEDAIRQVSEQPWFLEMNFEVVYEDSNFIALSKPFDVRLNTAREDRKWENEFTVSDWLNRCYPELEKHHLCHQIDSATSGLLVIAKNAAAARACTGLFEKRLVKKEYLALVHGHVRTDRLTISSPIAEHTSHHFKMKLEDLGKQACTEVQVLERGVLVKAGKNTGKPATLVLLRPITDSSPISRSSRVVNCSTKRSYRGATLFGRRHQLRIHLANEKHPIVGDTAYGEDWNSYRMYLHSQALHLPLPLALGGALELRINNTSFRRKLRQSEQVKESSDMFQHI